MAYENENRGKVMNYLARNVGFTFNEAKIMFTNKSIPAQWIEVIESVILAPTKKQPSPPQTLLDFNDPLVREHAIRYLSRAYGEADGLSRLENREFSTYDDKMMRTMIQLNTSYTSLKESRRNTLLTSKHEMQIAHVTKETHAKQERRKVKVAASAAIHKTNSHAKVSEVAICRAYKMNGEKCSAKTKNANGFCTRHSKK
jgi:hypothetical protein